MDIDNWISAVLALRKAKHLVVFTGAGVSAESGVPTFRDADGFWQRFPTERFASWSGLLKTAVTNPRSVAEFVLNVVEPIALAQPNAAHKSIAELETRLRTTVISQNIDGLHCSAGSSNVLEIHGSLLEVVDITSGRIVHRFQRDNLAQIAGVLRRYVAAEISIARCGLNLRSLYPFDWLGRHRPNLVLFGDALAEPAWTLACQAVQECDLLISIGTSGAVSPASMLPIRAESAGATVISIDPQPTQGCWLQGKAGDIVPNLIADAFSGN